MKPSATGGSYLGEDLSGWLQQKLMMSAIVWQGKSNKRCIVHKDSSHLSGVGANVE